MNKITLRILSVLTVMMLTACSSVTTKTNQSNHARNDKVLLASGYTKLRNLPHLTQIQNKFATEQRAKLNAYRELARQLYKERLQNNSVVADQVIKNESYRIYLDLFLREAKVVESKMIADQQRVVLALKLTPRFYQCFSNTVTTVSHCLQEDNKIPFTRVGYQQVPLSTVNLSCASNNCDSQLDISGFSTRKHGLDRALLSAGFYDTEWTVNMAAKTLLHYLFITEVAFD